MAIIFAVAAGRPVAAGIPPAGGAASESQMVLEHWNAIGHKLLAMAQDFPEDKFDYRPVAGVRTFAEQLLHAAGSMYFFTYPANGQNTTPDENPSRATYKSKAEVVAYIRKAVEDGAAAIKAKGDKGMGEVINYPGSKQQIRIADLAYDLIEHSGEHYGQLVVYYRVSGSVPPESRKK